MTIMLGLIMLGLILAVLGFLQVNENLKNIERLLHNEIERQHEERLAQDGRDRARADFSRDAKPIQKPDGRTAGIVARGLTAFADSGRRDSEPVLTCRPFSGLRNIASRDAIRSDSTILGRITSLLHT